jgi:hypothetical protein
MFVVLIQGAVWSQVLGRPLVTFTAFTASSSSAPGCWIFQPVGLVVSTSTVVAAFAADAKAQAAKMIPDTAVARFIILVPHEAVPWLGWND